jgi:hypothetical protein
MIHKHILPLAISDGEYKQLIRALQDRMTFLKARNMENTNDYRNLKEASFKLDKARKLAGEAESRGMVYAFREVPSTKLAPKSNLR